MEKLIFTISFFLFLMIDVLPQITVTTQDIAARYQPGVTRTDYFDTLKTEADIGNPGGGNLWDFSSLQMHQVSTEDVMIASSSPYSGDFPQATFCTHSVFSWGPADAETYYYVAIPNNYIFYGFVSVSSMGPGVDLSTRRTENPPEVSLQLPMTFGNSWSHSGVATEVTSMGSAVINSSTDNYTITHTVDAFGSLKMPDGQTIDALRVRNKVHGTLTTMLGSETYNYVNYYFVTKTGYAVTINATDTSAQNSGTISIFPRISWALGTVTGIDENSESITDFELSQNYPNPFNPVTKIKYTVPSGEPAVNENVKISVYDALGSEVAVLVNGLKSPGTYEIEFNGSQFPSGVYFYQLSAGVFRSTKKMMLLK